MSDKGEAVPIIRVAAKGDGVTADGRHASGAAPGDLLMDDGTIIAGPHHASPPCRHFPQCGGCQLQHLDEESLRGFVTDRVRNAAEGQGLTPTILAPAHLSPPRSRRRATLHAASGGRRAIIGFRESGSHRIVDMRECHVLAEQLFALVEPVRQLLSRRKGKYSVDVELVLTDQGVDCGFIGLSVEGLSQIEELLDFAREHGLARLTIDSGFGPEPQWEPEPVTITLGGVAVPFPVGSFLQATHDGEEALVRAARDWLGECETVVDLFSGLGTFAFALADVCKVLAVEAAREAHLACKAAAGSSGKPVFGMHRDLFRNPLMHDELNRFAGVLLDPPRAGAREQIAKIAESKADRIVYISCNPASWARDAKVLVEAGFTLHELRPVGQFRWSTHVELASLFLRQDRSASSV
ncbi:class I SAM-dependent RNA methyltransferase [Altererythrobacter sp. SALINAS58]|uniref:class I SAM-dependent RNA methyltransferase n=1 Tax=Alteripontixanthobacter muriae TaxID=2705546 RepID=UPI001576D676|nr:class I SAM-dependent RNA methyltransferase [Alteripontixanthobacter muriae]NTZ41936.1 class I SAM-dependent RNA methyltransferase [Alteripontixanthobacter muriae]